MFNRQTMTIPTGDIDTVMARHGFGFNDYILDNLIQGCPQMDVAVGVWRTIMQNIGFMTLRCLSNPVINAHFIPCFQLLRLLFSQIRFHGKISFGQV
ncbi:MAG: hypothetical protein A4E66_01318 [Syntrophus sp. PtaB.Bin001]|nr:MAG: hypothetical protein A4E66_01318 [Syntrophus sp. PtaB.Bin001]